MISLHISGNNYDISQKISNYIERKIGGLDKYLPKTAKNSTGKIILTLDPSGREDNQFVCEATLEVPGPNLEAREAAINMYTAVDIVATKLKAQAMRYKAKHQKHPNRAKAIVYRLLRREEAI